MMLVVRTYLQCSFGTSSKVKHASTSRRRQAPARGERGSSLAIQAPVPVRPAHGCPDRRWLTVQRPRSLAVSGAPMLGRCPWYA